MINPSRTIMSEDDAGTGNLWLKLAGLFALSFIGFAILFFGYEVFAAFGQDRAAELPTDPRASSIVIDPKIESELAKVLDTDMSATTADIKDPFNDRGGLTGAVKAGAMQGQSTAGGTGSAAAGSTASETATAAGRTAAVSSQPPPLSALDATKQRYAKWLEQVDLNGDVPLDPRIFAIEDLLPVGIVDGGSGQQEVMFYSEAAGRTLSFPLGTLFSNGWLSELRPEGVVLI